MLRERRHSFFTSETSHVRFRLLTACWCAGRPPWQVRELKEANHTIVIYSERKNLRDDWGPSIERMTLKTLLEFQIPFDEIHFGKPKAEVTIGPNAYNSQSPDLRRSIGWPEPVEVRQQIAV